MAAHRALRTAAARKVAVHMPAAHGNPEVPGQIYWMADALAASSLRVLDPRQLLANELVAPAIALRDDGTPAGE